MGLPEQQTIGAGAGAAGAADVDVRRWFVGIAVGEYDDPDLNLGKVLDDVRSLSDWFVNESGVDHRVGLEELARNPTWSQISEQLATFLRECSREDVIVIYIACHGEEEGGQAYLFGRDTPKAQIAGLALSASQLGSMLGSSTPHNVLVIVDACVAGAIAAAIADATRLAVRAQNSRDPYRQFSHVIIASTFGLDPAQDGRFVDAFLQTVKNERWTGSMRRWISLDQFIQGLNEELRDRAPGQRVESTQWFNGEIQLIPNPNVGRRQRAGLFADGEFAEHFDPASRGVTRSESGSFFTGRTDELAQVSAWLSSASVSSGVPEQQASPMFVITGSPGSGKSALLSRIAVLSRPNMLPGDEIAQLLPMTVPPPNALDGAIWCHGKTRRQITSEFARIMGGTAVTADALVNLAKAQPKARMVAVDALDEAAPGEAEATAREILVPLVQNSPVRLMIATRRHAVAGEGGDLLDALAVPNGELLDLDLAPKHRDDMLGYVKARLKARNLGSIGLGKTADQTIDELATAIVTKARNSFLVASIAARTAQPRPDGIYDLPAEVGDALSAYLERLPDPTRVRDVLRPLAWALGPGLPWGTIWPKLATVLATAPGAAVDDQTIKSALDVAGDLVIESSDAGEPVYRLFHEALADNLRATTPASVAGPAATANALIEIRNGRPWPDVPRYIRSYLPAFLSRASLLTELSDILLDPVWAQQRRIDTGDSLASIHDVNAGAALFAQNGRIRDLVPLCHQYSRGMVQAFPPLIEVLALSGQYRRAEALAANVTDVADRMLAYRGLAKINGSNRNFEAARRCAEEVQRALQSMHVDHLPMAWCWSTEAAMAAGLTEHARTCASSSLAAVSANDEWDSANGLFWAAMAAREAKWEEGRANVRAALSKHLESSGWFRNQILQAAAVSGCIEFLRAKAAAVLRGQSGSIRIGNLALALADAGLNAELTQLLERGGLAAPSGEPDSIKRFVWALAMSGRLTEALDVLDRFSDPVEQSKAIARIAGIIAAGGDQDLLHRLSKWIERLIGHDKRTKARLVRAWWTVGAHDKAIAQAETALADRGWFSPMMDPRVDARNDPTGVRNHTGKKTARRAMVTSRAPVAEQSLLYELESAAKHGDLATASALADRIKIPIFKARALGAMAEHDPDIDGALDAWMGALIAACGASRGEVETLLPVGLRILCNVGRGAEAAALERHVWDIDAAWQLELFVDEYASLRANMAPGPARTRILSGLMLAPIELAKRRPWTHAEVRRAWERGEAGSRLFAIGLMIGQPDLVVADLVVEGIRNSRSAFEQSRSLRAAAGSHLRGDDAARVVRAIKDELKGHVRPDGSRAWLREGPDRMQLAERVLERLSH